MRQNNHHRHTICAANNSADRPSLYDCGNSGKFDKTQPGLIGETSANSRAICEADCEADPKCTYFEFTTTPVGDACRLLDVTGFNGFTADDTGARTWCYPGAKKPPGRYQCSKGHFDESHSTTFYANNANSRKTCADECNNYAFCSAYDFSTKQMSNSCRLLKFKANTLSVDGGSNNREYCFFEGPYVVSRNNDGWIKLLMLKSCKVWHVALCLALIFVNSLHWILRAQICQYTMRIALEKKLLQVTNTSKDELI